ncbi:hypothetical protein DY000_02002010 [Brassica cretica]|uniref:Uncharacterized protein n=1 Tax=Brassica cretica TaxID=69181 RepID=A0ABQ7CIV1_BRACR|nr:hypothetical protein DY000_02002010 [Brassica cretica]
MGVQAGSGVAVRLVLSGLGAEGRHGWEILTPSSKSEVLSGWVLLRWDSFMVSWSVEGRGRDPYLQRDALGASRVVVAARWTLIRWCSLGFHRVISGSVLIFLSVSLRSSNFGSTMLLDLLSMNLCATALSIGGYPWWKGRCLMWWCGVAIRAAKIPARSVQFTTRKHAEFRRRFRRTSMSSDICDGLPTNFRPNPKIEVVGIPSAISDGIPTKQGSSENSDDFSTTFR